MILDYETYWNPPQGAGGHGNLPRLVEMFNEVTPDYRAVLFPPSGNIHPLNRELFEALQGYPDSGRFIPCAYINPNLYDAVDQLEEAVNVFGFKGMKLMPTIHRYNVDSIVTHPVMELAGKHGIPVTIHSSGEGGYPAQIGVLADSFPEVPIIMDHSGYRYFQRQALEAGVSHENLYFGLSLVVEPGFIETIAERIGPDKLIYGSNATGGIPKIGVMVFNYTGLSESEKEMALGKNLSKLLKL